MTENGLPGAAGNRRRVYARVSTCAIPGSFARQIRPKLGSGIRFLAEDEAAAVLAWSRWHRLHQQRARRCHWRRRTHEPWL
jgi:hypothetical protein